MLPAAAAWRFVLTERENCEYQVGGPEANTGLAFFSRVVSSGPCARFPLAVSSFIADRREGAEYCGRTLDGPSAPAQAAWFFADVIHSMNFAAAAGYFAVFGMP